MMMINDDDDDDDEKEGRIDIKLFVFLLVEV
jgi:hypothetical protein